METKTSNITFNKSFSIYNYIRAHACISKQDIVVGLGLSLPTVTKNLAHLKEIGLIDTTHKIYNTGGRSATAYSCIPKARISIGLHIYSQKINAIAVDLQGKIVCFESLKIPSSPDEQEYIVLIKKTIEGIRKKAGVPRKYVLGVGLAIEENHPFRLQSLSTNISYDIDFFHPEIVEGFAEVWTNNTIQDAFYISLDDTVSGAVILNNAIDRTSSRHIGSMLVDKKTLNLTCSATRLSAYTDGDLDTFFMRVETGDRGAIQLWQDYLEYLAKGVRNIYVLFGGTIILGGHVGTFMGAYLDELIALIRKQNPPISDFENFIKPCKYKKETAAVGAAITFVNQFISEAKLSKS